MSSEMTDAGPEAPRAVAIRVERARRRLTQGQVAERAGLDQATVSKAEAGRCSDDTYRSIAAALSIDLPEPADQAAS